MGGIEEGGITIGHLHSKGQQLARDRTGLAGALTLRMELDRLLRPASPVAEQASRHANALRFVRRGNRVFAQQVEHDAVIISRVNGKIADTAYLGHGANHVKRLIAVERGYLDS